MDTEIASGGPFTWQNSTMIVTIKELEGKVLWEAHYNYKGDIDPSRLLVRSADEAAMASLVIIINQFEKISLLSLLLKVEIIIKTGIALIIEKQKSPESQKDPGTEETVY